MYFLVCKWLCLQQAMFAAKRQQSKQVASDIDMEGLSDLSGSDGDSEEEDDVPLPGEIDDDSDESSAEEAGSDMSEGNAFAVAGGQKMLTLF